MKARPQNVSPGLCAKVVRVHEILCEEYDCPIAYFHTLDPLSELVSSLLSHRTKNADSSRAFQNLRAQFPDWQQVLAGPLEQIESAISPCTWPEQKAPRVQQVLAAIENERGDLNENVLDFLGEMEVRDARDWLKKLPGVGPKTSAAVLAFSRLRGRALPVDSHHHRVAARLGLHCRKCGGRPIARDFRIVAAARLGRAAGLRSSRSVDVARPKVLLFPQPGVRALCGARRMRFLCAKGER